MDAFNRQRRDFLVKALSSGLFACAGAGFSLPASGMGQIPRELPPGRSIYRLRGNVRVNRKPASLKTRITAGSVIETGDNSSIVFAVGKDAFILRSNSKMEISGDDMLIQGLRVVTGKLLSVFGKRPPREKLRVRTVVATIGIRGTGMYVEAAEDKTYICTCYGVADLAANNDSNSRETVITRHHDAPRYILAEAADGQLIQPAPVINHTDAELELIETLVGRNVPFAFGGDYDTMRKPGY